MRKRRKFADGGVTGQTQQPTYPFYGNQPMAGGQSGGMNQTFNMQPQAMSGPNDQMTQRFAKGGQAKVGKVMSEFKSGKLKSSSGQKVTNPKQAIAIGLSEAGLSKKAKGGEMKESKAMMKKEVSFMKKKGAPKSMVKHEMAEMKGMKKSGNVKKMAFGGMPVSRMAPNRTSAAPVHSVSANTPVRRNIPKDYVGSGGPMDPTSPGYVRPKRTADTFGVSTSKPPTQNTRVPQNIDKPINRMAPNRIPKMAGGGLAAGHKSADGIAHKGKTKAMQVKMAKGGATKMRKGGYC